ncbi:hypothetical protein COMNV_01408 [Commensalibacter sp. Nvir]|uniref:O-antigen ligase family protein n=1 Tax=Commensalibacter sp. Nvir TaxID=3069817 RepID=UPI002D6DFD72|nr:hypothetical protein COMNV_01408 [Commensalibacter sp. Nvir]
MDKLDRFFFASSLFSVLILPFFLTHFRGVADFFISNVAMIFVVHAIFNKDWQWVKQFWVIIAFIWWSWLVLCTIPVKTYLFTREGGNVFEAIAVIRFIFFVAALQYWVLNEKIFRDWLRVIIILCALYIVTQLLFQFIFGFNFFGSPRYIDGTLTGPYTRPRAAAPLSRIFLPITLYICSYLFVYAKGGLKQVCAFFILLFAIVILALAGQRMPFLLFILGLIVSSIWIRPLRILALTLIILIPFVLMIIAFISPGSFHHLVVRFIEQMSHFTMSAYGLVYVRALVMGIMNPWLGLGYDAFKHACTESIYFHGLFYLKLTNFDGGGLAVCLTHPHNHYLQALVDSGVPGLSLFILLIFSWLKKLAQGLEDSIVYIDHPWDRFWRVGLFAAVFIHEWPLASTSNFTNMPLGGWFFLILGLGLSYSQDYQACSAMDGKISKS